MAAPTISPKVGYILDPDGESDLGTNYFNWDKADLAAGEATVAADAAAPLIYQGAPVAERVTGICYTNTDNGAGGYNKRYSTYPYSYAAFSGPALAGAAAGYVDWGWTTLSLTNCFNNKAADQGAGGSWIAPVKGLYALSANYKWIETTDGILKGAIFSVNNTEQPITEKRRQTMGSTALTLQLSWVVNLNAGDTIRGKMFNQGTAQQLYTVFFAGLIRPIV